MKKILILLATAAIIMTTLTSCSGILTMNPDRLKIDKAYKFCADIRFGENNAKAQFERNDTEMWVVTLMEPFALEGMVMTCEQGVLTAQYEGLESLLGDKCNGVVKNVINAFENAVNGEGREVVSAGEEITITSKAGTPANSYQLVLDKRSLEPLSLKISEMSLTVEFYEVQVSQIIQVILPNPDEVTEYNQSGLMPIN